MRFLPLALACLPPLVLAACATPGAETATTSSSGAEVARLQRECDARGGILVPSGRLTPQESLNYVCNIRDSGTLPPTP
ncbi:MAG TPA: hypothetical protein VL460_03740 [Caulobacteraceae bacterium]|jgi:hypothetical protein|nr:hypothetical protein [Caulobacteraceae bacterium]